MEIVFVKQDIKPCTMRFKICLTLILENIFNLTHTKIMKKNKC